MALKFNHTFQHKRQTFLGMYCNLIMDEFKSSIKSSINNTNTVKNNNNNSILIFKARLLQMEKYKTLEIIQKSPNSSVFHLYLNNPNLRNALSRDFFIEFPKALQSLDQNTNVSVIILSGHGDHFCSGLEISSLNSITSSKIEDHGRLREQLRREIKGFQDAITAIEKCRKPVIAAIHGGCIGGGIDMISACDIRYCTEDTFFCVKEVDLAITADLGTLQRLPRIVGYGNAVELALTARRFVGSEAKSLGLVSRVFGTRKDMEVEVRAIAEGIASKPPLAIIGTKEVSLRSRDMTTEQGLDYVATWNSSMLLSDDLTEAVSAHFQKRKPVFAKL